MNRITCLMLVILGAGCAARPQPAPEDSFAAAWQAGQHNEHDGGAGSEYIHQMAKALGPALTASTKQCGGRPADTSKQPVQLALQLNADGSVRKALILPSNAYWDCVKGALANQRFPAPPQDAFWTSGTIG